VSTIRQKPVVDEVLFLTLHVARLTCKSGYASQGGAQRCLASSPAASSSSRRKRSGQGGYDAVPTSVETAEPAAALDLAALVGRAARLRPAVLTAHTRGLMQEVIDALLDQPGSGLRIRAHRLLDDLLRPGLQSGNLSALGASDSTAVDRDCSDDVSTSSVDRAWCVNIAHRILAALPSESSTPMRSAIFSALPAMLKAAMQDDSAARALYPHMLAAVRAGTNDSASGVRTCAAQACGALAEILIGPFDMLTLEGGTVALHLLHALFSDSVPDVRSAAVTAISSIAAAASKRIAGDADDSTGGIVSGLGWRQLPWFSLGEGMLALCADRSEKVRASTFRAIGFLAEVLDADDSIETPAGCLGSNPLVDAPPGLLPPGLASSEVPGDVEAVPQCTVVDPLLLRLGQALANGVRTPPPKCQWNACRAASQLFPRLKFLSSPHDISAHKTLLNALAGEVGCAENMKVRIQAAQALTQLPCDAVFWAADDADAILMALCDAFVAIEKGAGASGSSRDRQFATYLQTLRTELYHLGEHWAACSTAPPGEVVCARLAAASSSLMALICGEEDHTNSGCLGDAWSSGEEADRHSPTSKATARNNSSLLAKRLGHLGLGCTSAVILEAENAAAED